MSWIANLLLLATIALPLGAAWRAIRRSLNASPLPLDATTPSPTSREWQR